MADNEKRMKELISLLVLIIISAVGVFAQSNNAIFYQSLAWSPDGKFLSYTAMSDYDEKTDQYHTDIFIAKLADSKRQNISGNAKHAFSSTWTKDGKRIAFSAVAENGKDSDIFTVNKDGSDLIQLTKNAGQNATPSFSPDGKKIAFMSKCTGEKYQIFVMDLDGSNIKKLTNDSAVSFCNPIWSADGKKIVYYSDKEDKKDQIWLINTDGSQQTRLTDGSGHNIFPSFSFDGIRIIFSRRDEREADKSYVDASYLFVMNSDGSNLMQLSKINSFFARFSPDGKKIAFISGKFPSNNVFVANADGSNIKKIL